MKFIIKKYLWIAVFILGLVSCEEAPNNFSKEANSFLNAIDNKEYNGVGSYSDSTFSAFRTIISEFKKNGDPSDPLKFQNTRNSGASPTDAVYRFRETSAGDLGKYVGIVIENGGNTMLRTSEADTEIDINWSTAKQFATKK